MLKALVIQGDFPEVGDVLKISRAEGQRAFHTHDNVFVIRILYLSDLGIHIAVVSNVKVYKGSGVRKGKMID